MKQKEMTSKLALFIVSSTDFSLYVVRLRSIGILFADLDSGTNRLKSVLSQNEHVTGNFDSCGQCLRGRFTRAGLSAPALNLEFSWFDNASGLVVDRWQL